MQRLSYLKYYTRAFLFNCLKYNMIEKMRGVRYLADCKKFIFSCTPPNILEWAVEVF